MKDRVIVPISLGGSQHRCVLCPPPRQEPSAEYVHAMIESYKERWGRVDEVAFFDGGLPKADHLGAVGEIPWRLSIQPVDLSRKGAAWIIEKRIDTLELEVLSLDASILRENRRGYSVLQIEQMVDFFKQRNVRLGAVLSPGLPGSDLKTYLHSVQRVIEMEFSFVRIYPLLVLSGSTLEQRYREHRYKPLEIPQAVTMIRESVLMFEKNQIDVIRIGKQPKQDVSGTPVAGPYHPNLRSLIEFRRFFDKIAISLAGKERGCYTVLVNPKDISLAKGVGGDTIRHLRARLSLEELRVEGAEEIARGDIVIRRDR